MQMTMVLLLHCLHAFDILKLEIVVHLLKILEIIIKPLPTLCAAKIFPKNKVSLVQ